MQEMTPETLYKELKNPEKSNVSLGSCLKLAIKCSFVVEYRKGYDKPCEDKDFMEFKKQHEKHILFLTKILDFIVSEDYLCKGQESFIFDNNTLSLILFIIGENMQLKPWNTTETVHNCQLILSQILKISNYHTLEELISSNHGRILKEFLQNIRPKLLPDTWKSFPSAVNCYHWILPFIRQPELSTLLYSILPTALILVDDFIDENKILGINCLNHIVTNLTLAELQLHGHGDVIYNALMPILRIRNSKILNKCLPLLIGLTTKLEIDIGTKKLTQWSRFDEILEVFLENMECETLVDLQSCYLISLFSLLNAYGYQIIRWSKRLIRILSDYMEMAGNNGDEVGIECCIQVIEKFVTVTKPVSRVYARKLFAILLTALYNLTTGQYKNKIQVEKISLLAVRIIQELPKGDYTKLNIFVQNVCNDSDFSKIVSDLHNDLIGN